MVKTYELSCILETLDEESVNIIAGYFNGDIGIEGGPRGSKPATTAGRNVLNFINKYEYIAANLLEGATGSVDTFTCHNGSSTIDFIMVPKTYCENVVSCHICPDHVLNTSDHYPVTAGFNISNLSSTCDYPIIRNSIRWDKLNPASMYEVYENPLNDMLDGFPDLIHEENLTPDNIDTLFDKVIERIHLAAEGVPRSKYAAHLKPYWTEELSMLKHEKMHWFNLWKREGRTDNINDPVRINMKITKKNFRKAVKRTSRKYENDTIAEAARLAEIDRNRFWRLFKRMKGNSTSKVHAVKNHRKQVVYDIDSVLEVWRRHFSLLSSPRFANNFDKDHYEFVTNKVKE